MKSIDELPERVGRNIVVDHATGCWQWTGPTAKGYGRFMWNRVVYLAHRYVYEALLGPIRDGMVCDHLCRNRSCCNPKHIDIVTNAVNILRGESPPARWARETNCPRCGSELVQHKAQRTCVECKRTRDNAARLERYRTDPEYRARMIALSSELRRRRKAKSKGIA